MFITILGSCRQTCLERLYSSSCIKEELSYPHNSKEILQVIKYCKYNDLTPEETMYTLRTPILNKKELVYDNKFKDELLNSDVVFIEIATKVVYEYKDIAVHQIAKDDKFNTSIKNEVIVRKQDKDELEKDLLDIKNELKGTNFIIISHLVTYESGDRYNFSEWLEELCKKHDIYFINPVKELKQMNLYSSDLFANEKPLHHLTSKGEEIFKTMYENKLKKFNLLK